ncbi:MAG: serine/threonine-protein kinase [Persicimonas sp.]
MIGTSIARYEITEELGQGGMSVVYLARDTALSRDVAVKVLHDHLAKKAENRKRFRREAEAIARLRHPNILDVYDVSDESDDRSFIVMEYIPGMNLRQFIERHRPPPPEVAALIGVEICNALDHAHSHGVIHRDLKPENVMISDEGQVKLMDFGIAHVIDAETMTKTGSLLGSPAHMAPELIDGQPVDERADVFALGTVLYWMTTGELPFRGENAPQVLRNVMECRFEPPEVLEPKIGHDLSRIICKSLQKEPKDRYSSVDTVKRELLAAVHAVGFEESDRLVGDFFDAPRELEQRFDEQIVPRLIGRGKRAVERKNIPSAIAYFNRVLAYDPNNKEVEECLEQLNRSRRVLQVSAALATAALLGAAGWLIIGTGDVTETQTGALDEPANHAFQEALSRAEATTRAVESVTEHTGRAHLLATDAAWRASDEVLGRRAADRVTGRARAVSAALGERPVSLTKAPAPAKAIPAQLPADDKPAEEQPADQPESAPTHKIDFKLFPPSANLEINGEPVDLWYKGVELPEGRHRIRATADGCRVYRDELVVNGPRADKVQVTLDWKDAAIEVVSNKDALVFVDDQLRSRGRRGTIPIRFERRQKPTSSVTLHIRDEENPRVSRTRTVTVRPGEEHTLNVTF